MQGCIYCITEGRGREDLVRPINITSTNLGFGTRIDGICCNGHKFTIQTPRNTSRVYDDPSCKHRRVSRRKYIQEDCNLLLVLSAYLNGEGATELRRTAAALNLSSYKSCKKMYHKTSKNYVGHIIIKEARAVVYECLIEEIHKSFLEKYPYLGDSEWQQFHSKLTAHTANMQSCDTQDTNNLEYLHPLDLVASVDMGWQKRSSGRKYDSPSGHMFLVGSITNKVIDFDLKCVSCSICDHAKKKKTPPKPHHCMKNFEGHAKAMEAVTAAELVTKIYNRFEGKARISTLISDDDSSMRSHCSHAGGLASHIHEPVFLADPSHRCKIIGKPLFQLAAKKKSECTLSTNDATRLKVYTACFFNQNRDKNRTLEWMEKHVWCIVHHLFDDHQFCTEDFCYKKREAHRTQSDPSQLSSQNAIPNPCTSMNNASLNQLHSLRSQPGYYRSMVKDKKLFSQLKEVLARFFTSDALSELMHGHNTQTNEGLNTAVCMLAPKFKNYSKSCELAVRVSMTAACNNIGKKPFLERVITRLGFASVPTAFLDLLEYEDDSKKKRKRKQSSIESKSRRVRKRVSKALDSRRKDIAATKRGTTYGDASKKSHKICQPSTCPFSDYGCNTAGHTHKSISSSQCAYHYLWKRNKESKNPEKMTKSDWLSRVKSVWKTKNRDTTLRNQVTVRDIIEHEFEGDFKVLSPPCSNSDKETRGGNSLRSFAADSIPPTVTQDDSDIHSALENTVLTNLDMVDLQFSQPNPDNLSSSDESDDCSSSSADSTNGSNFGDDL